MNSIRIKEVTQYLENLAPTAYQESYDNSGLLVGNSQEAVTGILVSLDMTEEVLDEAKRLGCNLLVAHHPIIFGGLKRLTGRNYVERTVIKAIKEDIALYAIHTNLDNMQHGVNAKIGEQLGLENTQVLAPKGGILKKLTVFVPASHKEILLTALSQAGAGSLGNYSQCSFQIAGEGTFLPNDQAKPHLGQSNQLAHVAEVRIEMIFQAHCERAILSAMRQAHPYEEVAHFVHLLENDNQTIGAGMIGELPVAMGEMDFLRMLKDKMQTGCVKYTHLRGTPIKKVALCGGAGNFLRHQAMAQGADIFVTGDCKYHEFFDADGKMIIADIGHYESEQFTKNLLTDWLLEAFQNIPIHISATTTNPVNCL